MWTLRQIMDGGAMGVQITVSGKLRGDRSAFEKHTQGVLPRAGHTAAVTVSEDIAHVQTPMGLIGVRVRIAKKNAMPPEFERIEKAAGDGAQDAAADAEDAAAGPGDAPSGPEGAAEPAETAPGDAAGDAAADETAPGAPAADPSKPASESEHIEMEAEKMKELETHEEEEQSLK